MQDITISDLNGYLDAVRKIYNNENQPLWFRGHSKSSYLLLPNFFRKKTHLDEKSLRSLEEKINRSFREKAISFFINRGDDVDDTSFSSWRKLFLMQHYGAPTRLLDWTENSITALCFALFEHKLDSTPSEDADVWVINPYKWNNRVNSNLHSPASIDNNEADPYQPLPSKNAHLSSEKPLAIYGVHNSPRISRQQGTFVVFPPGKTKCMLTHSNEFWPKPKDSPLTRIIIKKEEIVKISKDLRSMGFNNSTIYPDLQGLAGDLHATLEEA